MSLEQIKALIPRGIAGDAWAADAEMRGRQVERYRKYMDGDFDSQMTPEMRRLANVKAGDEFGANYCDIVVAALSDRLKVATIDAVSNETTTQTDPETKQSITINPAAEWVQEVMDANRFDHLQMDVHRQAPVDGDTYILVTWDNEKKRVVLSHELAWDGIEGCIPVYRRSDRRDLAAMVKVWHETGAAYADTIRVNIYYAERVEKYSGENGGTLRLIKTEVWTETMQPGGTGLGVPFIPFTNRRKGRLPYGLSELEKVIPLQNKLIRDMYSQTMMAELNAFQIRWAKGFEPPQDLSIGGWVIIAGDGMPEGQVAEIGVLEGGDLAPYNDLINSDIEKIYDVSQTPGRGAGAGADASGEALKQREIGLLGKVEACQVTFGNAWEDVMDLAWRVQNTFGTEKPPDYIRFNCKWRSAQIRDAETMIKSIMMIKDQIGEEETLRQIGKVFDFDEATIQRIMRQKRQQFEDRMVSIMAAAPPVDVGTGLQTVTVEDGAIA
jgi:hypothetical protein